jgi:hypothetical protein
MSNNEFSRFVAIDFAPSDIVCEWCGRTAEEQLTAVGGIHHGEGGFFCRTCGKEFMLMVKGERATVDPALLELLVGLD